MVAFLDEFPDVQVVVFAHVWFCPVIREILSVNVESCENARVL